MSNLPRGAAVLAAVALACGACTANPSPPPPSPSAVPSVTPSGPPASAPASPPASQASDGGVYGLIRDQVEAIRGLEATGDVEPVTIDEAQLRENLEAELDAEMS